MSRSQKMHSSPARWDVRRQIVDGALLSSSDLCGEVGREDHLRAIHVTGVHDTWGVALGFAVVTSTIGRTVLVGAGLAYDACGRAIYSSHNVLLSFPDPPAGMTSPRWLDLLVRYRHLDAHDAALHCDVPREDPTLERREQPEWRWSFGGDALFDVVGEFGDDVRLGIDVPLARFRVEPGKPIGAPEFSTRRVARKLVRPYTACGSVPEGGDAIDGSVWHWTLKIDTSAGGFSTPRPRYSATLAGHPLIDGTQWTALAALDKNGTRARMLGPLLSIVDEQRDSFTIDVRFAVKTAAVFRAAPAAWLRSVGHMLPVAVSWIGMENVDGCAPPLVRASIFDGVGKHLDGVFADFPRVAENRMALALLDPGR